MIYASYAIYIYISLSLSLSHRLLLSLWHPPFIHTFMFNSSNSCAGRRTVKAAHGLCLSFILRKSKVGKDDIHRHDENHTTKNDLVPTRFRTCFGVGPKKDDGYRAWQTSPVQVQNEQRPHQLHWGPGVDRARCPDSDDLIGFGQLGPSWFIAVI